MHVVEEQVDQPLVEIVDASVAYRREDAPEVGVAGEEGGLDQRRVRDGVGGLLALLLAAPTIDTHGDELGCTFAVAHDGLRQALADVEHRLAQRMTVRRVEGRDRRVAGGLRGHQHEAVVGRGVAVDRDAVEALVGRLAHQLLQRRHGDHGVGGDEAQHGRHVGSDHPGALGDAGDGDGAATDRHLGGRGLGHRVGGHDALRRLGPARAVGRCRRRGIGQRCGQAGLDALDR